MYCNKSSKFSMKTNFTHLRAKVIRYYSILRNLYITSHCYFNICMCLVEVKFTTTSPLFILWCLIIHIVTTYHKYVKSFTVGFHKILKSELRCIYIIDISISWYPWKSPYGDKHFLALLASDLGPLTPPYDFMCWAYGVTIFPAIIT